MSKILYMQPSFEPFASLRLLFVGYRPVKSMTWHVPGWGITVIDPSFRAER